MLLLEPVLPVPLVLPAEPDMPEVPEPGVAEALDESDGVVTEPDADRLVEPVVLLAVVLGVVAEAVVSVVVLELGVLAVVVAGVVVVDVVVVLRSQPVAATVARASAATRGNSLFMASPSIRVLGGGVGGLAASTSKHSLA